MPAFCCYFSSLLYVPLTSCYLFVAIVATLSFCQKFLNVKNIFNHSLFLFTQFITQELKYSSLQGYQCHLSENMVYTFPSYLPGSMCYTVESPFILKCLSFLQILSYYFCFLFSLPTVLLPVKNSADS